MSSPDELLSAFEALIVGKPQKSRTTDPRELKKEGFAAQQQRRGNVEASCPPPQRVASVSNQRHKLNQNPPQGIHEETLTQSGYEGGVPLSPTSIINNASNEENEDEDLKLECNSVWVVMRTSPQKLLGVFRTENAATRCSECFVTTNGHPNVEIIDTNEDIGICPPERAERRLRPYDVTETAFYIMPNLTVTVRVFERTFASPVIPSTAGVAFLSLDKTDTGLVVIGASRTKEEAWRACHVHFAETAKGKWRKEAQWVDGRGMDHIKGYIEYMDHHWYVEAAPIYE